MQYGLTFRDGSAVLQPGISVLVFPGDATVFTSAHALGGTVTDKNGFALTPDLQPGSIYLFTTNATDTGIQSGSFYAGSVGVIDIDPTHATGVLPGGGSSGSGIAGGAATFSGDSATMTFAIPHGLGATPRTYSVTPASGGAVYSGDTSTALTPFYSADDTNLTVDYSQGGTPPDTATNNLKFAWMALP